MCIAERDDVLRERLVEPRDPREEGRRRRVQIGADGVHAILDDRVELPRQQRLIEVVLILANPDGLGLDAHELGERILQPASDRDRSAQRHVEIGELLSAEGRCRVDRGPGLRDHDLRQFQRRMALDQIAGERVGLPRRGAVSNRDELHAVARGERGQRSQRPVPVPARLVRIDGRRVEYLAGTVDDGDLDAGPQPRIQSHRCALSGWCGQEQVVQVTAEHADGFRLGQLAQPLLALDLEMREHSDLPCPADCLGEPGVRRPAFPFDTGPPGNPPLGLRRADRAFVVRQHDREPEDALLAPA